MASLYESFLNYFNLESKKPQQQPKSEKKINESFLPDSGALWGQGMFWGDYMNRVGTFGYDSFAPITNSSDRINGFDFPYYYSLADLQRYVANSRYVAKTNCYAQGLLNGLSSYVLGSNGITFNVKCDDPELQKLVTDLLNEWYKRNNFDTLQVELYERSIVDGEYFIRKFFQKDGFLKIRTIEPEHIQIPAGQDPLACSLGILCEPDDPQTVLGYGVYHYRGTNEASEIILVDANEIIHDKKNVTASMKRGIPTFVFDTGNAFIAASKLARNIATLATTQSSVAFIRQHAMATQAQVQDFVDTQSSSNIPPYPFIGTPAAFQGNAFMGNGTILDMPKSLEYKDPPSATNIQAYIETLNMALRECGRKFNCPEWFVSGKGDSINFASSLTTESPFLRSILKQQKDFKETVAKIITAVIQNFAICDLIPINYKQYNLEVDLICPSVQTREQDKEANMNKVYLDMGIKSPQTICGEIGLDYAKERANFEALKQTKSDEEEKSL
jgi:hypothetical protein